MEKAHTGQVCVTKVVVMKEAIEARGGRLLLVSPEARPTSENPFEGTVMIYADRLRVPRLTNDFVRFLKDEVEGTFKGSCDIAFEGDGRVTFIFTCRMLHKRVRDPHKFMRAVRARLNDCFGRAECALREPEPA